MAANPAGAEELAALCRDLRRLWEQAGGPSVRRLAEKVGLGKTQISVILSGGIRRPPDWYVVRGIVEAVYKHAHDHGRQQELTIRAGADEYWRPRHAAVERAAGRGAGVAEHAVDTAQTSVPYQLPPVAPHFVGRLAELTALSASTGGPLLITGMAGVGKTTLAIAWAHEAAGLFPDGQLYLNLRGFDPSGQRVTPDRAVRVLLETLLPAGQTLPPGLDAQVGLYRSLLADRRMLVVLDNAHDADQVRVLLPGAAGCRAVVTSRMELTGLVTTDGAYALRLDVLPDAEAHQLLANRLGRPRVSAEPEAVTRLIAICGGLPLALAVVAARAASRRHFALAALADETDRARGSLNAFGLGDPSADTRAIFSWSYQALAAPAARLFRLLGVVASPDIGLAAVASLAGLPEAQAEATLAQLCRAHLVTEAAPGRFAMHDLMRAYAAELAGDEAVREESEAAHGRYLDYCVHTAFSAAMLLSPARVPIRLESARRAVTLSVLPDRAAAMRWFAVENDALLAAAGQAAARGHDRQVWQLAWAVADFYELHGRFHDWVAVQQLAIAAARRSGDAEIHGRMLLVGGNAHRHTGDLDGALRLYEASREVFERAGTLAWQARAVHGIGSILERQGRYEEALAHAQQALEIYRAAGDRTGEARAGNSLGWRYSLLGRHEQAISECRLALAYYQSAGDIRGQASTWDSLGHAHHGLGRNKEALDCYREALRGYRQAGDRYNQAGTMVHLGDVYLDAGEQAEAYHTWGQALEIYDRLKHPEAQRVRQRLGVAEPS